MDDVLTLALQELAARETKPRFRLEDFCFPEQLAFIRDPARFKAACCSRRAGKSIGCAADLIETSVSRENVACLYLAPTLKQAKRIIWKPLKDMNEEHGLGGIANESEFTLRFPNGSVIYLSGAKDANEVSKYLGYPLIKVYIDEAQSYRAYIETLVDEVLGPTLYDYAGTVCLIGTPGPVPVGYFYNITKNPKWANHFWTMFQNPFLKLKSRSKDKPEGYDPMELVLQDCDRMGVSLDSPKIQRQCFGKWTTDTNSLVFRYGDQNHYDDLPKGKWSYVVGVDLGYSDADAIAILGWTENDPVVYLVDEVVKRKQGISELADQLAKVIKRYEPLSVVMDTGGLGLKIAEEMVSRYQLPIKAAKKTEKFAHIELVNDALRTGRLMAKKTSQFAQDSFLLEWDKDKSSGDKLVVSDAFHSDITDAVLYAFREAQGWLVEPAKAPGPVYGTREWAIEEQRQMEERAIRRLREQEAREADPFSNVDWGDVSGW